MNYAEKSARVGHNLDMRNWTWCLDDRPTESQENDVFHSDGERIQWKRWIAEED